MTVYVIPQTTGEMKVDEHINSCFYQPLEQTLCVYEFKSPAFIFRVWLKTELKKGKAVAPSVPSPSEVFSALDRFSKDLCEDIFTYMGSCQFIPLEVRKCYSRDKDVLYANVSTRWLSCLHSFRKSYTNFAENFNPSNYQIQ